MKRKGQSYTRINSVLRVWGRIQMTLSPRVDVGFIFLSNTATQIACATSLQKQADDASHRLIHQSSFQSAIFCQAVLIPCLSFIGPSPPIAYKFCS
ncbi:hypothetical protein VTN96DRAFT_5855 [Rasamsonia emersonii]